MAGLRTLIVEDDKRMAELIEKVAVMAGFDTRLATSQRQFMELFPAFNPQILVLDIVMPDMDGYEATKAMRTYEKGTKKHTSIIAITADAMQGNQERCIQAGMDDYLNKPVKDQQIEAALEKWAK